MTPEFAVDRRWADAVQSSEAGWEVLRWLDGRQEEIEPEELRAFVLFRLFYYLDILIDCDASDWDLIPRLTHESVNSCRLLLPHRFGRRLYDRFNDDFKTNRTDHLLYETAFTLLHGQPRGPKAHPAKLPQVGCPAPGLR